MRGCQLVAGPVCVILCLALASCGGTEQSGPIPAEPGFPFNEDPSATVLPADPAVMQAGAQAGTGLAGRGFAQSLWVGAAVDPVALSSDATYRALVNAHFALLAPENAFKYPALQPTRGEYSWQQADSVATYARQTGKRIFGHVFLWGEPVAVPAWLATLAQTQPQTLQSELYNHMVTVMGRYKDVVLGWDVVNEAVRDDGAGLKDNIFTRALGADYVASAFQWAATARQAAGSPNVALFYNDYGLEWNGPKTDRVFALLKDLKARGIAIDGVGFQTHLDADNLPSRESFEAAVRRFAALGLQIHISEMDVGRTRSTDAELRIQASAYRMAADICRSVSQCTAFITWGVSDARTWLNSPQWSLYTYHNQPYETDYPLLFSANGAPKHAYQVVANSFDSGCKVTLSTCRTRPDLPAGHTFFDRWDPLFASGVEGMRCRERAQEYVEYCGNSAAETVTTSFMVNGTVKGSWTVGGQAGFSGCLVRQAGCAAQSNWQQVTY